MKAANFGIIEKTIELSIRQIMAQEMERVIEEAQNKLAFVMREKLAAMCIEILSMPIVEEFKHEIQIHLKVD